MNVEWIETTAGRAVDACRAALQALGMRESNMRAGISSAAPADIRVLPVSGNLDPALFARELQGDEAPTLLLAATDEEEILAQRVARPEDDVARTDDAPESLMRRLGRLLKRRQERVETLRALDSDPLTGLLNRNSFTRYADGILDVLAPEAPAAVFLLDIDNFKRINDQYGHDAGDKVLTAVAKFLRTTLAETAPAFRFGGEEFCWIAIGRQPEDLDALALRILEELRTQEMLAIDGRSVRVTASIGWTRLVRGMTLPEAILEADQAMYEAKARGRDCVRSWQALSSAASAADADIQLVHFQNVAKVVNERATNLVTLFGRDLVEKARRAADQDRLTQIWNRGYFDRRLAREFDLSSRDGRPLSIVMMDLDHFGQFNKVHGLPTGDAVLRRFATVAESCIRVIDWFARYGGEEFALVLPGTLEEAAVVAERIRKAVEETVIDASHGKTVQVTVSIGIATLNAEDTQPVDLVQRVSDALQTAKRNGRNRVAA